MSDINQSSETPTPCVPAPFRPFIHESIPVLAATSDSPADLFRRFHTVQKKDTQTRSSYPREFKLLAIRRFREVGNKSSVARELGISTKVIREWVKKETRIIGLRKGSRRNAAGRKADLPLMEELLNQAFLEVRERGFKVSCNWFFIKAKRIYESLYPENVTTDNEGNKTYGFGFSIGWFNGFKGRFKISLRCITNKATNIPAEKEQHIRNFHHFIRKSARSQKLCDCADPGYFISVVDNDEKCAQNHEYEVHHDVGRYKLRNIANMDQTPLPFQNLGGRTYEPSGSTTVWAKSQGSGLDKRQATAQLTIFADGEQRQKAVLVFHGTGKRTVKQEQHLWDPRVRVYFQQQAWVDEEIFCQWLYNDWGTHHEPRMLTMDVHRPHRTDRSLAILKRYDTIPAFVPAGCTSLVQPLDVSINKIFKDLVDEEFQKHYADNLDDWTHGSLTAQHRRILLTKWVGEAWEKLHLRYKDVIINSFRKLGISLPIDGSCDSEIHIKGIDNYVVGNWWENPAINYVSEQQPIAPGEFEDLSVADGVAAGEAALFASLTRLIPMGNVAGQTLEDLEFVSQKDVGVEVDEWADRVLEVHKELESLPVNKPQQNKPSLSIPRCPEFY